MRITGLLIASIAAGSLAAASAQPAAGEAEDAVHRGSPPLGSLAERWNRIYPGGDTTCLYGTEYSYFVRPDDPRRLLITFPGGGVCWSGATCSDEPRGRMNDDPKTVRAEDSPAGAAGVFAEDNPENPFAGYTKVHVGYCTGDMHIGDAVRSNEGWIGDGPRPSDVLHFNGHDNAMRVLDWVFGNVPSPETVVVAGITSGSYATPFYVSLIADHYAQADVRHLGDGNGALYVGERLTPLIEAWNAPEVLARYPGFGDLPAAGFTFEDVTIAAARRHPDIVFTQIITAHDQVWSELLESIGVEAPILEIVEAGQQYVKRQVDNYRTFVAGGNMHVISLGYFDSIPQTGNRNRGLPEIYDRFYSYQAAGRRYRDWVADMVAGRPIEDVRCRDCEQVDYYRAPE